MPEPEDIVVDKPFEWYEGPPLRGMELRNYLTHVYRGAPMIEKGHTFTAQDGRVFEVVSATPHAVDISRLPETTTVTYREVKPEPVRFPIHRDGYPTHDIEFTDRRVRIIPHGDDPNDFAVLLGQPDAMDVM